MEMNFPHKNLSEVGTISGGHVDNAHHALLAHAIARQSLSFSARCFVARCNGETVKMPYDREQGLEERIKYFSGQKIARNFGTEPKKAFLRGHFRPDLIGVVSPMFSDEG